MITVFDEDCKGMDLAPLSRADIKIVTWKLELSYCNHTSKTQTDIIDPDMRQKVSEMLRTVPLGLIH